MKLVLAVLSISILSVGAFFPMQQPIAVSGALAAEMGSEGPLLPPLEEIRAYYRQMPPVQRAWTMAVGLSAAVGWGALLLYGIFRVVLHLSGGPRPVLVGLRIAWLVTTGTVLVAGSVIRAIVSHVYYDGDWLCSAIVVIVGCVVLWVGWRLKRKSVRATCAAVAVEA